MAKKTFGPQTWLYPMPAVLVGVTIGGKPNFMTAAWCGIVASMPPTLVVGVQRSRYTYPGMSQEFSINVPSAGMVKEVDYCGITSGKNVDKSTLFTVFYGALKSAPLIEECPVNLECTVRQALDVGSHMMYIGEIVETHVSESCLTDGTVDVRKVNPLIFTVPDRQYWSMGDIIARAFEVGKQKR